MFIFPPFLALATWITLRVCCRLRPAWRPACEPGLRGGRWVGGIALLAGYVGPLVLSPGSNQGPLLGIFVLGPLGYVIGAFGGLLLATRRPAADGAS